MLNFFKIIIYKLLQKVKVRKLSKLKNVDIQTPFRITEVEKIKFGNFVYIGPESNLMSKGGIQIGSNVISGPQLTIWTENHNFKSDKMVPYDEYDLNKPVVIQDNVWIGLGVKICPGTIIGEGAIIGMGSVVRGEIPPLAIVFGNPAQVVGYRDASTYKSVLDNNGFYYKIKKEKGIKRISS